MHPAATAVLPTAVHTSVRTPYRGCFGVALPEARRQPGGLRALGARAGDLLKDPRLISPQQYTLVFSVDAGAMILSSVLFRLLVLRVGPTSSGAAPSRCSRPRSARC